MEPSRIAFYTTSATIIPVMVLAIGLQLQGDRLAPGSPTREGSVHARRAVILCALSWLIIGTIAALGALAGTTTGAAMKDLVWSADAVGIVLLAIGSLLAVVDQTGVQHWGAGETLIRLRPIEEAGEPVRHLQVA